MPAFLTHWYILMETARRSEDAGSDLGSIIVDTSALRRRLSGLTTPPLTTPAGAVWHTGPLPAIDYSFPGSDISAMAYIGSLAPDIVTFHRDHRASYFRDTPTSNNLMQSQPLQPRYPWSTLLHTNRSGSLPLALLELIAEVPSPAVRSMALAFLLGYLTHIATDIAINPWLNVIAHTFQRRDIAPMLLRPGLHSYVRLCLDVYIAHTYFQRPLYSWFNQPWHLYLEPAARDLQHTATLTTRVLDLLTAAIETTYGLSEAESKLFRADFLAGLRHLRSFLAGRDAFFWLALNTGTYQHLLDPIATTVTMAQSSPEATTLPQLLAYTLQLSERLCRSAISYYASLRNTNASAEERSQRRVALCNTLHDWDLNTGYSLDVSFDQEITLRFLHNWLHFSTLWNSEAEHHSTSTKNRH
jgi:hypothetical protein